MSIRNEELQKACREVVHDFYKEWYLELYSVITNLQAPELSQLPAAYQKAAYLNMLLTLLDALGGKEGRHGPKLSKSYFFVTKAIKRCVEDYKNRWDNHLLDLETHLARDYADVKASIVQTLGASADELFGDRPDSFLNQVIVPGVSMVGAKRLALISDKDMAAIYCTNLLNESGLFNIYDSTEEGLDSVATVIQDTFKTMALRMQDIYYALYQPLGLGGIVYSRPGVAKIRQCIEKFEEQVCRGKRETVAHKHIRTKGADALLLYAWYLEVKREAGEGVVIQILQNPKHLSELIGASVANNILWHLDELVDERHELIAWNQTLRLAA